MRRFLLRLSLLFLLIGYGANNETAAAEREYVESLPVFKRYTFVDPEHGWKEHLRTYCVDGYLFMDNNNSRTLIQVYEKHPLNGTPIPKECDRGK